jgi:hypothetical protein
MRARISLAMWSLIVDLPKRSAHLPIARNKPHLHFGEPAIATQHMTDLPSYHALDHGFFVAKKADKQSEATVARF